jgi:putative ABC transport system permease protein
VASASATVVSGANHWSTNITGSTGDWFTAGSWTIVAGRDFTEAEERGGRAVCVLGETVRRELFRGENPVGSRIRVGTFACEVIGLLASKGQAGMGGDRDDTVVLPLRTVQRRITGDQDVGSILVTVREGSSTAAATREVEALLRERRRIAEGEKDDFDVMDTKEIAEAVSGTTRVLTMLLGAVAAVSLLVGGIGIMNIMLVSVTERTREIGIRLAIGALERQVLQQFLIEAVSLSALGGVVGVVLATIASIVLTRIMALPYGFGLGINLLSFAFSAAIGVIFGYFPARRAAHLDPIEALRYE